MEWYRTNAINFSGVQGTARNCSGGVSPWSTIFTAEETSTSIDTNGDGYEDLGWLVELYPATRTVLGKRFKMGVADHENGCFKTDGSVAYWGADNGTTGFVYKFVPTVPGDYSAGSLFVLDMDAGIPAVEFR